MKTIEVSVASFGNEMNTLTFGQTSLEDMQKIIHYITTLSMEPVAIIFGDRPLDKCLEDMFRLAVEQI